MMFEGRGGGKICIVNVKQTYEQFLVKNSETFDTREHEEEVLAFSVDRKGVL